MSAPDGLFAGALAASALVHSLMFLPWPVPHGHSDPHEIVDLDLLAPAPGRKGRGAKPAPPPRAPEPAAAADAAPALPAASPVEAAHGHSHQLPAEPHGDGGAEDGGDGGGGGVTPPLLLNHGELRQLLRTLYPESERAQGREGLVVLDLTIDESGRVSAAEIARSGGKAFDRAALELVKRLSFSPAVKGGAPFSVKLRQSVVFKIERGAK